MADLMPTKKIWTSDDGVQIEYVTYRTILVDRVRNSLTRGGVDINADEPLAFILCAATVTNVVLPETPPLWGQILYDMVKGGHWLEDPCADYRGLAYAPSNLIDQWYTGYKATRDQSYAAPTELQQPAPLKPDEGAAETGEEGPQDESHPIISAAPSLSVLSPTGSGKRSRPRTEATS